MSLRLNPIRRLVAIVAAMSLAVTTLPLHAQPTDGGLITTEAVVAQSAPPAEAVSAERARLLAVLDRAELAEQLRERGVTPAQLRDRVAALTDAEAAELMARIDSAPAGADVIGTLFAVFVILLVTDILGFTKVFPFTRPVR